MSVILTKQNLQAAQNASPGVAATQTTPSPGPANASNDPKPDDAISRIMKMIPGEATAAYTAAIALATGGPAEKFIPPFAFVLCIVIVFIVLRRSGRMHTPPVSADPKQYAFQLLAFFAWAFTIRNPLEAFGVNVPVWLPALAIIFIPVFGSLLLGDSQPQVVSPAGSGVG